MKIGLAVVLVGTLFQALLLEAAVTYRSEMFFLAGREFSVDLDGDGGADLEFDLSRLDTFPEDPYFLVSPLGATHVARTGPMTTSFSIGDIVDRSALDLLGAPGSFQTGGLYYDGFGNPAAEGWGGCAFDVSGNLICPPGGPTYQIDLFLVELGEDIAWVDVDASGFGAISGRMILNWGYFEEAPDSFSISAIPEPSLLALLGLGFVWISSRRCRR